jgi:hypothetical protein
MIINAISYVAKKINNVTGNFPGLTERTVLCFPTLEDWPGQAP